MKNRKNRIYFRALSVAALAIIGVSITNAKSIREAFSEGLGFETDEQGQRAQELADQGLLDDEHFYDVFPEAADSTDTQETSQPEPAPVQQQESPAPAPVEQAQEAEPQTEAPTPSETPKETPKAPAKTYSHDFDMITEEAKENLIHFSEDGVADSMYLNIAVESAMNVITGRELNTTYSGKENAKISYVDSEGEMQFEWLFENWQSEDDYSLDLSAYLEDYENENLKLAYRLSLQDATLPENNTVKLRVSSPYADGTTVNLFTDRTGELEKAGEPLVSEDGYFEITFTDAISSLIISPDEIIVPEAAEEPQTTEDTDTEAAEDPAGETETIADSEPAEEVQDIVEETEVPAVAETEEHNRLADYKVPLIIAVCAVIAVVTGTVVYRRQR